MTFRRHSAVVTVIIVGVLGGCSTGSASFDDAAAITAPAFVPPPPSPAESPQLDALVLRDTAGLGPPGPNADPTLVARALAALEEEFPGVDRVADLYFDDGNVWMTITDPDSSRLERGVYWSEDLGLSVGDAYFMEDDTMFPIEAIDIEAITAVVDGLAERYPTLQNPMPRLSISLSYGLGLSWRMELVDGRGALATIYTDLDGTVTVVDQS